MAPGWLTGAFGTGELEGRISVVVCFRAGEVGFLVLEGVAVLTEFIGDRTRWNDRIDRISIPETEFGSLFPSGVGLISKITEY